LRSRKEIAYGMIVRLVSALTIGSFCYLFESKLAVSAKT
jgi:hypothetical protein